MEIDRRQIQPGMPVRSGDGEHIGHVGSLLADGFLLKNGPLARWEDVIEVRDGAVWVSTHSPELGERRQASPQS